MFEKQYQAYASNIIRLSDINWMVEQNRKDSLSEVRFPKPAIKSEKQMKLVGHNDKSWSEIKITRYGSS